MRRGLAWTVTLALGIGAMAACGGDDGSAADPTTTTAGATTEVAPTTATTGPLDPAAEVDRFCALTDELDALLRQAETDPNARPSPEEQARVTDLSTEAIEVLTSLEPLVAQMVPGDAARFQGCVDVLGGVAPG